MVGAILTAALTAYLLGNLNGAVCVSALIADDDVRRHGSGNAGLTNFFRNYGFGGTALVILVDIIKTVAACYCAGLILVPYGYFREGLALGAVAVSLGHDFPALLGFKGGKGILCGFTISLILDWRIGLAMFVVFVLCFWFTRYVSLGSVIGAAIFAIGFVLLHSHEPYVMTCGVFLGLLAIFMHRGNISRLIKGTEKKVHLIHTYLNKQE